MFHSDPARERAVSRVLQQILKGQNIAMISFVVNLFMGFLEVGFGWYYGSLALSADGVHSFVDAVVSLTVWFGIRFAARHADGTFHYGYFKFDAIFSLFAAIIMVVSGMFISYTGILEYIHSELHHQVSFDAGIVAAFSIATAVVLAKAKNDYAKRFGLVSLRTDAYNSVKDASASVIALVGIALTWDGLYSIDSLAGLVIGLFVMVAGYFAIKESSLILADAYNNPQTIHTITEVAKSVEGIHAVDDLRIRRTGPFLTIEMHIRVDGNISVFEADRLSQELTRRLREKILSLGRISIKPEPEQNVVH